MFELPCPGCGLTRSFCSISAGHPVAAFTDHLTGPFLYGAMVWILISGLARCFDPKPDRWILPKRAVRIYWYTALVSLGLQVVEVVNIWFAS